MKTLIYCQHVLGVGHYFRTLEIARSLPGRVVMACGGPEVRASDPQVERLRLDGLAMDEEFSRLFPVDPGLDLETVKARRQKRLWDFFLEFAPDVFFMELYPFGRKAFRFELDPVLKGIQAGDLPRGAVAVGIRDILVEKRDVERYEERVVSIMNRYVDALLVHADPVLVRLEETFGRTGDLGPPVHYTGYVTPRPPAGARRRVREGFGLADGDALIAASAGGGKVGGRLLEAAVAALPRVEHHGALKMLVFTGPYMDADRFKRLAAAAPANAEVLRFSDDFPSILAACDLSVSLAGYNTTMNVLAAGAPALMLPFRQNREQAMRAARLADRGLLGVIDEADLAPERLAALMTEQLGRRPDPAGIDLNGAAASAGILTRLAEEAK